MSSNCDSGVCKGKGEGSTCFDDYECEVGYGCVKKDNFPFQTVCTLLLGEGKPCATDL